MTASMAQLFAEVIASCAISDRKPRTKADFSLAMLFNENAVLSTCFSHRLSGFVIEALQRWSAMHCVSEDHRVRLNAVMLSSLGRQAYQTNQLILLLEHFAKCRIPVILLKGCALRSLVYQELPYREMSDFDLMIRHQDIPTTRELLKTIGASLLLAPISPPKAVESSRVRLPAPTMRQTSGSAQEILRNLN